MTAQTLKSAAQELPVLPVWARLREDIGCVKARDPAARHTLEIILTYPGVHALILHRLANHMWRKGLRFPARLLSWFGRLVTNIDIHPGATLGRRLFIDHGAGVVIGETAEIGDDVTLYHGVTLGGTSWSPGKRHPTVESDALIGAGAKILGPITVCAGARVGANSVVVEDVPPGMTVVGIPGRVVRYRHRRPRFDGRIDLEHHLIPDPVGDALARMLDRIEFLEARVTHLQGRGAGQPAGVAIMAPAAASAQKSNAGQRTISAPHFDAAMETLRT